MTDKRIGGDLERIDQIRRDFVANASHELRTPLTVLRGYIDMMHDESATGGALEIWRDPLENMVQQAERMQQIIADMLTLARLEVEESAAKYVRVDVQALLDKIMRQAESMSRGNHTIQLDVQTGLNLLGHAAELENAFSNLIFNAIQHTPAGSQINVRWHRQAQRAVFEVSDNGPGIPAEDIPRLTERFYRVDVARSRASGGTGLGLAIVKHALERHDSVLEINSQLGAGSAFRCVFPPRRIAGPPSSSHA
ncbi:MAG TPA: ATP-binding protein [Gammaproteobacteria bacterium]|jgi:two-component system phosphate regulon sensor histidine kinase PhoR|nr:ATP-binding protein [Gammaproteobacteria bacterium]